MGFAREDINRRIQSGIGRLREPRLVIHDDPMSIFKAYAAVQPYPLTAAQMAEAIENLTDIGYWGFADICWGREPTVNIWIGAKATPEEIRFLIAHELGHCAMRALPQEEEIWADGFFWVQQHAERFLKMYQEHKSAVDNGSRIAA
jgi:hypothetical protein